jgi:hypothetical protein
MVLLVRKRDIWNSGLLGVLANALDGGVVRIVVRALLWHLLERGFGGCRWLFGQPTLGYSSLLVGLWWNEMK